MRSVRLLAVSLALLAGPVLTACTPMDNAMVAIFGRSMRDQRSFDPYEDPRYPAENSVPFAAGNYATAPGLVNIGEPEGSDEVPAPFTQLDVLTQQPAVMELVNTVEPTEESLARGEQLFLRYCAVCHGPDGAGTNCYFEPEVGWPCAFPLVAQNVIDYPDGYIYGMIRVGRGIMPPYGHQIAHYDRWNIVNYIRQLQGAQVAAGAPDAGVAAGANAQDGE